MDVRIAPLGGRTRIVQTDHRSAAAIALDLPISIVATAIRCLNPLRAIEGVALFYNFVEPPPNAIEQTITACGALRWIGNDVALLEHPRPHQPIDEREVTAILDASLANVADELLRSSASSAALSNLETQERTLLHRGFPDEDTAAFWSTVLHLGALAGAAIRASAGGQWFHNPSSPGTLPVDFPTFKGEAATITPLGKALKFLRGKGNGDEPSALVRFVSQTA